MRLKAGDRLDRFEIVEPLREGAYAETYKARDTKSGDMVLIKSPNPLLFADPAIHQRFMRESEIARHLNHPGVQRSVDLGENRSEPYLALEYIEGDNLRRWLRRHKLPLSIAQAVQWGKELAEALSYLHQHNIVHRDLKPENVIVTGDGHLKIIDFGTALLTGARRLTWRHLTEALGTPDYMSPEQIQGERGDPRSDIYSWGIMMYEFLTGRVPFEGDNWLAVMAGHLQRYPKPVHELRPEVPGELEAVVLTAMRRLHRPLHRRRPRCRVRATAMLSGLRSRRMAGPAGAAVARRDRPRPYRRSRRRPTAPAEGVRRGEPVPRSGRVGRVGRVEPVRPVPRPGTSRRRSPSAGSLPRPPRRASGSSSGSSPGASSASWP
ncbi:MAG: serine/threonine protein kinase [Actinobacteria bacterium]|nr:MAG: serine/threonine protein kinase [Actinomycetota bacterium]